MLSAEDSKQANLLANLKMAEAISHSLRRVSDNPEWERLRESVLEFLHLQDSEFEELKEDMTDKMSNAA